MAILKVLNVGNGDSMIITPPEGCRFHNKKIIVDLGPCDNGQRALSQNIQSTDDVHIFITHSHQDHFGGIKFFETGNMMSQVSEITVPFYQNEIINMIESILNLKGMENTNHNHEINENNEIIKLLKASRENHDTLKKLKKLTLNPNQSSLISFAYENRAFCSHIVCLNPPLIMDSFDWIREVQQDSLLQIIREVF